MKEEQSMLFPSLEPTHAPNRNLAHKHLRQMSSTEHELKLPDLFECSDTFGEPLFKIFPLGRAGQAKAVLPVALPCCQLPVKGCQVSICQSPSESHTVVGAQYPAGDMTLINVVCRICIVADHAVTDTEICV